MIKRILNTGISDVNKESLNHKIKLNNIIAFIMILVGLISIPYYLQFHFYFLIVFTCLLIATSLVSIYLVSIKKYLAGFCVLVLGIIFFADIISLKYGLSLNFHFFLICACIATLILFERVRLLRNIILGSCTLSLLVIWQVYAQKSSLIHGYSEEIIKSLSSYAYFNFFVLFVFAIILFASFIDQNSIFQKEIINKNLILEQKNGQITDSIKYAKHIQNALLPSMSALKAYLEESFVLYKPKDIVAGDFYWLEALKDDTVLFAAADSTGHGVPGAMVSVVCTNALNRAVKEFGLTDPGLILDKVRELVVDSFQQADPTLKNLTGVKDGMDISLCLIDKKKKEIKWAGANNPLWLIRKDSNEIEIIKPDKQSVAKTENPKAFTTHTVQLQEGDCFYIFTDGYADQFGGESAKKFMQKRLKELLLKVYQKPMEKQKYLIHDNLLNWMGNLEQVDDICFVGVKI